MSVYFIQCGDAGPIKIGFALAVDARLSKMQSDCPYQLTVLAVVDGDKAVETQFHRRFEALHFRGEWYWPGAALLDFVVNIGKPAPIVKPFDEAPVGNPMRALRKQMGITQTQLARHLGMRQPHLCRMERADLLHPRTHLALLAIRDMLVPAEPAEIAA